MFFQARHPNMPPRISSRSGIEQYLHGNYERRVRRGRITYASTLPGGGFILLIASTSPTLATAQALRRLKETGAAGHCADRKTLMLQFLSERPDGFFWRCWLPSRVGFASVRIQPGSPEGFPTASGVPPRADALGTWGGGNPGRQYPAFYSVGFPAGCDYRGTTAWLDASGVVFFFFGCAKGWSCFSLSFRWYLWWDSWSSTSRSISF